MKKTLMAAAFTLITLAACGTAKNPGDSQGSPEGTASEAIDPLEAARKTLFEELGIVEDEGTPTTMTGADLPAVLPTPPTLPAIDANLED